MKCRETKYWLYSFRPNSSWPVDVVGHLQECPQCRQLQTQLKQIDQGVGTLTSSASDPSAKTKLLGLIDKTPQRAMPRDPFSPSTLPWARIGVILTGCAALLLIGWLLGRSGDPVETIKTVEVIREKPVEVVREKIVEVVREKLVPSQSPGDRKLVASLVKHNARLVQSSQLSDRVDTLLDMAEACRQHALMLFDQGPREALPMTVEMYTQLLRDGVMPQLTQAPSASRTMLQTTARARLEKMGKLPAASPGLPKVVEDQRSALASTTRQMLDCIDHPENLPAGKKPVRSDMMPPSAALVQFALVCSNEADPMTRADACADYVQLLMPTMMLYLADNSSPQGAEMGQQFGDMITFGVYRPVEQATAKEPTQALKDQAERILNNAGQTVADIEKHLQNAPKDKSIGLERAVQASKHGKGWGKGKDKDHPGKGKKDDGTKGPRNIQGTLKNFDAGKSTLTVLTRVQGREDERIYSLPKELHAIVKLAELKMRPRLQLQLSENRRAVVAVQIGANEQGEREHK